MHSDRLLLITDQAIQNIFGTASGKSGPRPQGSSEFMFWDTGVLDTGGHVKICQKSVSPTHSDSIIQHPNSYAQEELLA